MMKKMMFLVSLFLMVIFISPVAVMAEGSGEGKNVKLIAQVVTKLMAKGDQSVIAIGRILKAETLLKQMKAPAKAIAELDKLTSEIDDSELLFAANTIKMLILKETEKDPEKFMSAIDKVINSAKKNLEG